MTTIASCAIHPAVGVARVGNSPDGVFVGPEIPGEIAAPMGGYKDPGAGDRVKRQAARFRIFAFDEQGGLIGELTHPEATITWRVQVANAKAEWDKFAGRRGEDQPLEKRQPRFEWRNRDIDDKERAGLIIAPSAATLSGPARRAVFGDGTFLGRSVTLGEARTDAAGRLLVLAGRGESGTVEEGRRIAHYANNDRWFDDIADGPVQAEVTLPDGRVLQAKPAWVVTAPPDFSPETPNVVTLYDVAWDTAIVANLIEAPKRPSFTRHIYPLLERAIAATWTSAVALKGHTTRSGRFDLKALCDPSNTSAEARQLVFTAIRNPFLTGEAAVAQANPGFMPPLSGDDGDCEIGKPGHWLTVTRTQHRLLEQWAKGDFDADWTGVPHKEAAITPEGLDRAALDACAGGAFYPGIEGGWIFRKPEAYSEPFRLNAEALQPGDVSKRMAVPWQADFFECRQWWWPAQRPDDVIPARAYARIREIDRALADEDLGEIGSDKIVREELLRERHELFLRRVAWARDLPPASNDGDNAMVTQWSKLGFVASTTPDGQPVDIGGSRALIETQAALSPKIELNEAFHRLVNIERHPEFRPVAREIALNFLASADYSEANYRPFDYSVEAFRARLDKIYNDFVAEIDSPYWLAAFPRAAVVENLRQKAPLNLTDGAWLHHVLAAGPTDDVRAKLFSIWSDEAGNGRSDLNHCNVYDTLLRSLDVYMPPVHSRAFVEQDLLPSAWENAVFQFSMGLFPDEFLPELLGMTLYLEWEATPTMLPIARALRDHQIDPQFYAMHAAIDNVTAGHGALAREAVELHLDKVKADGGEAALQREWRRIWNGYVTWATLGSFGSKLYEYIIKNWPPGGGEDNARERMIAVVRKKAPYARTAHGEKVLGGMALGSLFADPERLLDALVVREWVDPKSPRDSRFVTELLGFHGPMYKVFSEAEMDTLLDWIGSLDASGPGPTPITPAERVRQTLVAFAKDAALEAAHRNHKLPDGAGGERSVADWFAAEDPDGMMAAFAESTFVVKGEPDRSPLITRVFASLMPGVLTPGQVEAFRRWITNGCPKAGALLESVQKTHLFMSADLGTRQKIADDEGPPPFALRRQFIGAGSVH